MLTMLFASGNASASGYRLQIWSFQNMNVELHQLKDGLLTRCIAHIFYNNIIEMCRQNNKSDSIKALLSFWGSWLRKIPPLLRVSPRNKPFLCGDTLSVRITGMNNCTDKCISCLRLFCTPPEDFTKNSKGCFDPARDQAFLRFHFVELIKLLSILSVSSFEADTGNFCDDPRKAQLRHMAGLQTWKHWNSGIKF